MLSGNRCAEAVDDMIVREPNIPYAPQGIQNGASLGSGTAAYRASSSMTEPNASENRKNSTAILFSRGVLCLAEDIEIKRDMTLTV